MEQGAEFPRHCNPHCFLSAMFYYRLPCTMFISCFIIVLPCTIHAPFRSIHWTELYNCSFKSIGELFCPAPYFALILHCATLYICTVHCTHFNVHPIKLYIFGGTLQSYSELYPALFTVSIYLVIW